MPSDYQKQIKEIFGTSDLDELRELAKGLKSSHSNPRNAGRKAQLTPDQTVEVLELHRQHRDCKAVWRVAPDHIQVYLEEYVS